MSAEESALYTPQYGESIEKMEEPPHFEMEVERYSFQDLLALNQLAGKTTRKWLTRISRIIPAVLGCALLGSFGLLLWIGSFTAVTVASLLLGLLSLVFAFFHHYLNAWQSRRLMMKNVGKMRISFHTESFANFTECGTGTYPYDAIYALYHYKECFFIFLDKRHGLILPEISFIRGLAPEFAPFLKEKCGKEVIYIR